MVKRWAQLGQGEARFLPFRACSVAAEQWHEHGSRSLLEHPCIERILDVTGSVSSLDDARSGSTERALIVHPARNLLGRPLCRQADAVVQDAQAME